MTEPRPLKHLRVWDSMAPRLWRSCAERADQGRRAHAWPEWCYLPIGEAAEVFHRLVSGIPPHVATHSWSHVAGLSAWRATKGIYEFDPELLGALVETPVEGKLPVELLERLPQWCVYIPLHGHTLRPDGPPLRGFYAHLEFDARYPSARELRLLLDLGDFPSGGPNLVALYATLEAGDTIERSFARLAQVYEADVGLDASAMGQALHAFHGVYLARAASLLLYLCAEDPDYEGETRPHKPAPKPRRRSLAPRRTAAEAPQVWRIGARLGTRLRAARERRATAATHASPLPHVRRGHWHLYWTGKGRTEPRVRWVHPTLVGARDADEVAATTHPVAKKDA